VLLCTNSDDSDKRVPIVIGKLAKPQCFKNVKKLPVTCYANSKAWKMSEIFRNFLHALDALGRKILLFVDNCATHSPDTADKPRHKKGSETDYRQHSPHKRINGGMPVCCSG
jgi:hypothetical protein